MDQDFLDRLMARGLISQGGFDRATERMMTHEAPDAAAEDIGQRVRQTGQNLWGTFTAPIAAAKQLGQAATSGTLDVTDPRTAGQAFDLVGAIAGARAPFAKAGELGATGGKPFWIEKPELAAKADDLIARGYTRKAIADELGVGNASVGRYLDFSGRKTAAAENPALWDDPANVQAVKDGLEQGLSHAKIAAKLGTSPGNVSSKIDRLRAGGELPDYQKRAPYFWDDPEKQAQLKQLAAEGWSQGAIANKMFGGELSGRHPRRGDISAWIKGMQERQGEMLDYVPQGGTGITAAGRTPTLPQLKSLSGEAPPADRDYVKALRDYLRGQGLTSLAMPQYG